MLFGVFSGSTRGYQDFGLGGGVRELALAPFFRAGIHGVTQQATKKLWDFFSRRGKREALRLFLPLGLAFGTCLGGLRLVTCTGGSDPLVAASLKEGFRLMFQFYSLLKRLESVLD